MLSSTLKSHLFLPLFLLTIVSCIYVSNANKALMTCEASRSTLKYVNKCPMNGDEWREAALKKKCSEVVQHCSSGDEFVYHCLINSWENETVDVCALRANIIGKCAEYNVLGATVQDHYGAECTQCPVVYPSDEAFLYQECYKLVKRENQAGIHLRRVTSGTDHSSNSNGSAKNICVDHVLLHVFTLFVVSLLQ